MTVNWQSAEVSSLHLSNPVEVIAAKNILYVKNGHRFQTLNIYVPKADSTIKLIGQTAIQIPTIRSDSKQPRLHVHIHGCA